MISNEKEKKENNIYSWGHCNPKKPAILKSRINLPMNLVRASV